MGIWSEQKEYFQTKFILKTQLKIRVIELECLDSIKLFKISFYIYLEEN